MDEEQNDECKAKEWTIAKDMGIPRTNVGRNRTLILQMEEIWIS